MPIQMIPGAEQVRIGTSDPPPEYIDVGPIEASHGHGCGMYGEAGTYSYTTPIAPSPSLDRISNCSVPRNSPPVTVLCSGSKGPGMLSVPPIFARASSRGDG